MGLSVEQQRTLGLLEDPSNYARFDLTADLRRMIGCIDPRAEQRQKRMMVIIQTPGGGVGEGNDRALVRRALFGYDLMSIADGAAEEAYTRPYTVLGAHKRCAYAGNVALINAEQAKPGDFTRDNIDRWMRWYGLADDASTYLPRLADASGRMADMMITEEGGASSVVDVVGGLYPQHANVATMVGDGNGQLYVVDHHPHVGLDRERLHNSEHIVAQVYHDNLGAELLDLQANLSMPGAVRGCRAAAAIMRSAATLTVISGAHPDIAAFEAFPTGVVPGIQLEPLPAAA